MNTLSVDYEELRWILSIRVVEMGLPPNSPALVNALRYLNTERAPL